MAYQSLYRRYRPRRFADVRGQEHVIRALRNAVKEDRVGHAYLFSGPRGTGKTSTARILAKALNCENLVEGEPDGTCESCLAIDAGTSYDVQELDAASNNGVNDVRELIGRVNLGSPGRTKVYILDEVHMLTAQASAALLKTLEEPPDHVVFVLATTDPQKVLPTIRSRTQHFDFHLLSVDELSQHVAWVIDDAQLGLPDEVIEHVVRSGAGSARDTLSALDQVAAAGGVLVTSQPVDDLLDAIASADAGRALVAVADAVSTGRDPRVLGEAVLSRLRDVFLVRMGASTDHLAPGDIERIKVWAADLGDRATTRALEAVGEALLEMRQAPDPRIPLEVALVKITRVDADPSLDALAARVAALEAALAGGATVSAPAAPSAAPPPSARSTAAPAPRPVATSPAAPSAPSTPAPAAPPERAAPPPRPGVRPGDAARAALASQRDPSGRRTAAPAAAAPPASPSAPAPTASTPPAPAPSSAPPAPPATGGSMPDVATLNGVWDDEAFALKGAARAMYRGGEFTEVTGTTATVVFPNEAHRDRCESKRDAVEAALSERFGLPVSLRLLVAGASAGSTPTLAAVPDPDPAPEEAFEDLGVTSVSDLDDAPSAASGGLDALTDAFPGAEFVE